MCAHERSFLSAYHRSRYIHVSAPALPPAVISAFVPASASAPASAFAPGAALVAVLVPARIPLLFQPVLPPIPANILNTALIADVVSPSAIRRENESKSLT